MNGYFYIKTTISKLRRRGLTGNSPKCSRFIGFKGNPWTAFLLLMIVLALGTGCPRRWPKGVKPITDIKVFISELSKKRALVKGLSGTVKVDHFSRQGRIVFKQVVVAVRPALLHLETLSPFEHPVSVLVSDGKKFALYDMRKKIYYHGPASPRNISRILPIILRGREIVEILLGGAPILNYDSAELIADRGDGVYRFIALSKARKLKQTIEVDPRTLSIINMVLKDHLGVVYSLAFKKHRLVRGVLFPHKIHFLMPREKVDMIIKYRSMALNPPVEAALFKLDPPRGIKKVRLE